MAFQTHVVPPGPPRFLAFDELSGVDPVTGRQLMFLAVTPRGSGCTPPGPPNPSIALRVGTGPPATLVSGRRIAVAGPSGPAGQATLSGTRVQVVEVEVLAAGAAWQIEVGGTAGATLVVADDPEERAQPWTETAGELAVVAEVNRTVTRTLTVANRGTGPLRIDNPAGPLGAGFALTDVTPRTIDPNMCAQVLITFGAPAEPGQLTAVLQLPGARVTLTATVRRPLWNPGDLLLTDAADDATSGVVYRVSPSLGQSVLSAAGWLMQPNGMAFDADGHLLVADGGPVDGQGWLLRIDRYTGAQTVLSSGGHFVSPAGVAVAPDGTVFVADAGPFSGVGSVIKVDPRTGDQTVVASEGRLANPCDLVLVDGTILVLRGDEFGGNGKVIKVAADGSQSVLAEKDNFTNPSLRPQALAREPSGSLLVAETHVLSGGVIRIDAATGGQQRLPFSLKARPVGIATAKDGRIVVSVEPSPQPPPIRGIFELDRVSGAPTSVSLDGLFGNLRRLIVAL